MRRVLIYGLIIATVASCKRVNVDKELVQIDSLRSVIKSAEIAMNQVDVEKIKGLNGQMNNQIMLIKNLYGDSIEWEKAKLVSKYHSVSKYFGKYVDKRTYIKDEITYSYQQLSDLTSDLENNIMRTDSFLIYFEKECLAVGEIKDLIDQETEKVKTRLNSFEDLSPKVETILEEQNSRN